MFLGIQNLSFSSFCSAQHIKILTRYLLVQGLLMKYLWWVINSSKTVCYEYQRTSWRWLFRSMRPSKNWTFLFFFHHRVEHSRMKDFTNFIKIRPAKPSNIPILCVPQPKLHVVTSNSGQTSSFWSAFCIHQIEGLSQAGTGSGHKTLLKWTKFT